jgi:hypothetical protein
MNELNFDLKSAGYKATFIYGGIIVEFPKVTISVGKDPDKEGLFMVNVQEDLDFGPKYTSLDDQTAEDVMKLCASHAPDVSIESPALS